MIVSMNPIRWLKTFLFGWIDDIRVQLTEDVLPGGERMAPLPPRVPPEALAMLKRPGPPPAATRVVAAPLRGSLRDRMQRLKEHQT